MKRKMTLLFLVLLILMSCVSTSKKLAEQRAKDYKYQYNLGLFHLNQGNVSQAMVYLNRSLNLNSEYYLTYNALGLAYAMQGNLEKSISYFEKCLKINSAFTEARNNLGIIFQQMGFLDKAQEEFLKVVNDPKYEYKELPYYNLALLSLNRENNQKALEYIDLSLQENSKYGMGYNLKGKILESLGNFDEAIENYRKALEIVPNEMTFKYNLGAALFHQKNYQESQKILESLDIKSLPPELKEKVADYLRQIKSQIKNIKSENKQGVRNT